MVKVRALDVRALQNFFGVAETELIADGGNIASNSTIAERNDITCSLANFVCRLQVLLVANRALYQASIHILWVFLDVNDRTENELDVKVPKASAAKEKAAPIGDVIVNVKADGNVVVNRRTLSSAELSELLKSLVQLNAEQAVVIRGDEGGAYKNIVGVLNICTEAGVTNVAFATAK